MEPFRPIIADSVVLRIINMESITAKSFHEMEGAFYLKPEARKTLFTAFEKRLGETVTHPVFGYKTGYRRILEVESRLLGRFLEGELATYSPLTTR